MNRFTKTTHYSANGMQGGIDKNVFFIDLSQRGLSGFPVKFRVQGAMWFVR